MKQINFLRYYLLFFAIACLFIVSFNQLYKSIFAPPIYYTVNVDDVFATFQNNLSPEFKILQAAALQIDQVSLDKMNQGEIIAFDTNAHTYYLKALDPSHYIQWGPVPISRWEEPKDTLIILIFYSALALLFLLLFRPLFRDVAHLQSCAIEFGKKPVAQALTVNPKSGVFPLAKALHTMSNQLLEQIQIHKDLANIIAHEVRTPLARMKFVLQKNKDAIPEKDLKRFKTDIRELEMLAHDYLEFGRNQITDPNYLQAIQVSEFIDLLHDKFSQSQLTVTFTNKAQTPTFWGNEMQLELAITNLLNNALRYAKQHIRVGCQRIDGDIRFAVEDDGPGFSATQINSANGSEHKGFGLGLYIVKQVAGRHNGRFTIGQSQLGGASMTIQFPLAAEQG